MLALRSSLNSFSVLQWNCLADCLCDTGSFPAVEPEFLVFEQRSANFKRIIPQIIADIICLQEIDHPDLFIDLLPSQSYECFFQKKPKNPDGILLAYNTQKFSKINLDFHPYLVDDEKSNQFFMALHLRVIGQDKQLTVIGTHLKSKKENEKIRIQQILQIVKYAKEMESNLEQISLIILGDFNAQPTQESMRIFHDQLQSLASVNPTNDITTYKIRKQEECHTIDYIHYSVEKIKLVAENILMTKETIGKKGLPNETFPSDHLYLFAIFTLL